MEKKIYSHYRSGAQTLWQELLDQKRLIHEGAVRERLILKDLRAQAEILAASIPAARPQAWRSPAADPAPRPPAAVPGPASPARSAPGPQPASRAPLSASGMKRKELFFGAAAALVLAVIVFAWRPWASPLRGVYPLPFQGAAGLCADPKSGTLYTADPARQLVFAVSPVSGQAGTVQRFPAPALKGLACGADGVFWSSDAGHIYRHDPARQNAAARRYPVPGLRPGPLYWDGRTLWAAAADGTSVERLLPGEGLSSIASSRLRGKVPAGLAVSGDLLWVLDAADMKVYRFPADGGGEAQELPLEPLLAGGSRPAGLALSGDELWVLTDNPSELRAFRLKRLGFRRFR